ncbi:MAG: helix-turn-helix domain-containing protein [Dongiaceae bacterium]
MAVTGISRRSYRDTTLTHSHGHHQVVLALEGSLEMEVEGRGGRVEGCALVAVAPGRSHSCRADGRNRFLVLDWDAEDGLDEAALRFADACARDPFLALDPKLLPLLRFLDGAAADATIGAAERRDWARLLLRRLGAGIGERRTLRIRRLDRALGFLAANMTEPLTVGRIAAAAHTSSSHLHALFRRHLGRSPMGELAEIRLEHARRLLAEGDGSIASVAVAAGYAEQSSLTRAFRRRFGITPARYRQGQRRARPAESRSKPQESGSSGGRGQGR